MTPAIETPSPAPKEGHESRAQPGIPTETDLSLREDKALAYILNQTNLNEANFQQDENRVCSPWPSVTELNCLQRLWSPHKITH